MPLPLLLSVPTVPAYAMLISLEGVKSIINASEIIAVPPEATPELLVGGTSYALWQSLLHMVWL